MNRTATVLTAALNDAVATIHAPRDWRTQRVLEGATSFDRLWAQHGPWRVMLHRFTGTESPPSSAYYHPHNAPLAALFLGPGVYLMDVGTGKPRALDVSPEGTEPTDYVNLTLFSGSTYRMTKPTQWHAIRVNTRGAAYAYSICVFGPAFDQDLIPFDPPALSYPRPSGPPKTTDEAIVHVERLFAEYWAP